MSNWDNIRNACNAGIVSNFGYACTFASSGLTNLVVNAPYDDQYELITYTDDTEVTSTAPVVSALLSELQAWAGTTLKPTDITSIVIKNNAGAIIVTLKPREFEKDGEDGVKIICNKVS